MTFEFDGWELLFLASVAGASRLLGAPEMEFGDIEEFQDECDRAAKSLVARGLVQQDGKNGGYVIADTLSPLIKTACFAPLSWVVFPQDVGEDEARYYNIDSERFVGIATDAEKVKISDYKRDFWSEFKAVIGYVPARNVVFEKLDARSLQAKHGSYIEENPPCATILALHHGRENMRRIDLWFCDKFGLFACTDDEQGSTDYHTGNFNDLIKFLTFEL